MAVSEGFLQKGVNVRDYRISHSTGKKSDERLTVCSKEVHDPGAFFMVVVTKRRPLLRRELALLSLLRFALASQHGR